MTGKIGEPSGKKTKGQQHEPARLRVSARMRQRIPEVSSLYTILPPRSSSSGREFARVVNLLLFHTRRREEGSITLFDDRAGDVQGLDAYEEKPDGIVGYQHKFFPCPLSAAHRAEIKESLIRAAGKSKDSPEHERIPPKDRLRLKKWILVTPEDFVEPSGRKDAGDVSWFKKLRDDVGCDFDIEHWGHTHLQGLFLQIPSIGLYYYPELYPNGVERKKTINGIRAQYDKAIVEEHGRIEFVGMSVYKEESTHAVPIEQIYIPLSAIANDADENDPNTPRRDPVDFLALGSCHVILGDPGSGKTTLLKFLALLGRSKALQRRSWKPDRASRFQFISDERLPVFVTLRRYADAIKSDDNLSLIEYMRANIEADLSIGGVPIEFIEYYLESGNAILLFDGVDELPSPTFKIQIRNRIRNLAATYPGTSIIVTSRVYGYQGPFSFDKSDFVHHKLAKLRDEEIAQFVKDWYNVRFESPREREEYLDSLLAILRNDQHVAIRDLARNPLLLTIMVLVHRIDAVLPDERHVLYQKCTETLLNTWHTSKFHEKDRLHRAKVDQHNMHRMQAIAYWMHHEMGGEESGRQAVVTYKALKAVLSEHISEEKPPDPDYSPDILATDFIEFVQDRAGLLVEIGDRQFSFIHLTFQEYLTAARIKTLAELNGVSDAWGAEIENHCADPRWREVLRLLVAGYADEAQLFLVEKILACAGADANVAQVLGGLLLDGVASAVVHKTLVIRTLVLACTGLDDSGLLHDTLAMLRACREKTDGNWEAFKGAARSLSRGLKTEKELTCLRLVILAAGMDLPETWKLCRRGPIRERAQLSFFAGQALNSTEATELEPDFNLLWATIRHAITTSPGMNRLAASLLSFPSWDDLVASKTWFETLVYLQSTIAGPTTLSGPFTHFVCHLLLFSPNKSAVRFAAAVLLTRMSEGELTKVVEGRSRILWKIFQLRAIQATGRLTSREDVLALSRKLGRNPVTVRDPGDSKVIRISMSQAEQLEADHAMPLDLALSSGRHSDKTLRHVLRSPSMYDRLWAENPDINWAALIADPVKARIINQFVISIFDLRPLPLWDEALGTLFLPTVPRRAPLADPARWHKTVSAFADGEPSRADIYSASWQVLFDGMLFVIGFYGPNEDGLRKQLKYSDEHVEEHRIAAAELKKNFSAIAESTRQRHEAPLQIAHCFRDICYGDETGVAIFEAMIESGNPDILEIFKVCGWPVRNPKKKRKKQRPRLGKLAQKRNA
jgi:hypothetical protein